MAGGRWGKVNLEYGEHLKEVGALIEQRLCVYLLSNVDAYNALFRLYYNLLEAFL